jgi:uncharacterized phage protein gp47/JayE
MALNSKTFATLVSDMVTAIQGTASTLVDLTIGSILRALVEANAAVVLWLQGLILSLLATTRAATSNGADLDSWMADYGITRLAAVAASGNVTFSRYTTTNQAVVLVGATVQTADGTQQYTVTLNALNPAYNAGLGGYVIAAGAGSVTVQVTASTAGAAGNAAPGAINTLASAIPYVDTVTNVAQFTTGQNSETDAALRVRFVNYINNLSKATRSAILNAVSALGNGMYCTLIENQTYAGATQQGYITIVVDDGTGAPSGARITAAIAAIDAVRPIGSVFGVFSPVILTIPVSMTVTVVAGADAAGTKALVQTAVTNFLNALTLGAAVPYTRLLQVAYDASANVQNISAYTLNGGTADLAVTNLQVVKAGVVLIS